MRRVLAILAFLSLVACAQANYDAFDLRLSEMAGGSEASLLGSMGRIPDNSYQLDDNTKILQWRWDTSYISPGSPPMYRRIGWGWTPIGGFPPTLVRESCIVEWTVTNGSAQAYRWQGSGCRSVAP